jgi:hypothetical protein
MATPGFATALTEPLRENVQIVQGIPSTPLGGVPTLAGFELWIPPKSNVFQDGMPIYEVRVRHGREDRNPNCFDHENQT